MQPSMLQSETARANGAKSHGPVTEEGKAAAAQNSLKHGFCSKHAILPGEDQQEFDRRRAEYIKSFQPRDQSELDLVETLAIARWRLNRLVSIEANLLASAEDAKDVIKTLSLLTRYENQLNRTYEKAFQMLQAHQQNRPQPESAAVRNEPQPASKTDVDYVLEIEKAMRMPVPASSSPTRAL